MSMTPTEDEQVTRVLLGNAERWRNTPEARQAAEVRVGLAQARAARAQNILTYLTADRTSWPADVDAMLRDELGIDDLPPLPSTDQNPAAPATPDRGGSADRTDVQDRPFGAHPVPLDGPFDEFAMMEPDDTWMTSRNVEHDEAW